MISARDRIELRREAILLWQMVEHDHLALFDRTADEVAESRATIEHVRADRDLRAFDRQHRLISSLIRNPSRSVPDRPSTRPTLLIADGVVGDCVAFAGAVRDDGRVDVVADVFDGDGALGWALVEQPDVVLLSTELSPRGGIDASERIAMFAPRTRQILLVEDETIALAPTVDRLLPRGTERHLLIDAVLGLCAA